MPKHALVTGGAGQDGSYLIDLLQSLGYAVHAQRRRPPVTQSGAREVQWHVGDLCDREFLTRLIDRCEPDEIYNLAAVSRPALSWQIPEETLLLNALVPQRICQILQTSRSSCRFFQASSSDIFGNAAESPQNESTRCEPNSPYGISKAYAHRIVGAYRNAFGLHACCGILFNHDSPRRPLDFVTQKIAHAAAAISLGISQTDESDETGRPIVLDSKVRLGNVAVRRDFAFAGDVAKAMHLIVQSNEADDYVIGTGEDHSIAEFCEAAFAVVGRNWREHVTIDQSLVRPVDTHLTRADPSRLKQRLGWSPTVDFKGLVAMMVEARIKALTEHHTQPANQD